MFRMTVPSGMFHLVSGRAGGSAAILSAPFAEFAEPLRRRVRAMTGAPPGAVTVAADAFSPRTPE